jgi:hypothetical protein
MKNFKKVKKSYLLGGPAEARSFGTLEVWWEITCQSSARFEKGQVASIARSVRDLAGGHHATG